MDVGELVAALQGLVLEQRADGRFVASNRLPAWCQDIRPGLRWDEPFLLDDVFPVVAVFLPEAERAWTSEPPASAQSDLWAEVDAKSGRDMHLVAAAANVRGTRALLIVRNDALFHEKQGLLQRARELRMTHRALMEEIEQKDILIHAIVHDLAAPLHSIVGVLSLLDERTHEAEEGGLIRVAMLAANRQRELITEILDIFAAESGALGQRGTEPVDLPRVLEQVMTECGPIAKSRNVDLQIEALAPTPALRVAADEMRLVRVLTNLVENAFRHSPPDGVVRVSTQRQDETVTVFVDDDGAGVRREVVPRLFQKFARGRNESVGTGLGLFFCRISVENWGGGIGYEQRDPPGGARFWIRLNVVTATTNEREAAHGQGIDARR